MSKPRFDPSKPFEVAGGQKPRFDPSRPFEAAPEPEPEGDAAKAGLLHGAQSLLQGFGDEIQGLGGGLESLVSGRGFTSGYTSQRDALRAELKALEESNPDASMVGKVGGTALSAFAPMGAAGNAAKGASLLAKAGKASLAGAGMGGLAGAGYSEADTVGGVLADTAVGAGLGAAGGAVAPVLAAGAGKLAGKTGTMLSEVAERRAAKAAGVDKAALKRIARRDNGVQEFGRTLLDEDIVTPFASSDDIATRSRSALGGKGQQIGQTLADADAAGGSFPLDDFISRADTDVLTPMRANPFQQGASRQVDELLGGVVDKYGQSKIPLGEANKLKGQLDDLLYGMRGTQDPASTASKAELQKLRRILNSQIEEGVGEALPDQIDAFKGAKNDYGWLSEAARSSENAGQRELANRFISPSDYLTGIGGGVGMAAAAANPAALLAAVPAALGHKLVRTYGNQVAARSLDKVGGWLKGGLGRAGAMATEASSHGAGQAAAKNYARMFPNLSPALSVYDEEQDPLAQR